jgi:hypothetical protein
VALHALGRGVLVGAIAVSALLAVEFDFGVPRIFVAALMGFLGFAFVSAGDGLVTLLRRLLLGLFRRLRFRRAEAALRAVPPVPVGRILGTFVYTAGDVLWPQTFLKHVNLPVVGEIGIALLGLAFAAVALARMEPRTRVARATLIAVPGVLIAAYALWVANPGFDGYLAAAPSRGCIVHHRARGPGGARPLRRADADLRQRHQHASARVR